MKGNKLRKRKQLSIEQRKELAEIMAELFRGREGVELVGSTPDFSLRCRERIGHITWEDIVEHLSGDICLGIYQGDCTLSHSPSRTWAR